MKGELVYIIKKRISTNIYFYRSCVMNKTCNRHVDQNAKFQSGQKNFTITMRVHDSHVEQRVRYADYCKSGQNHSS